MQQVLDHLRSHGYELDHVVADGKLHRFGPNRKSCWYVAHTNFTRHSGQPFFVITFGNWAIGEKYDYCTLDGKIEAEDRLAIKKQVEEAQKRNEKARKDNQEKVAVEVQEKWDSLSPVGTSPYLERKGISGDVGVRFDGQTVYVPMRDIDGRLWSLQKIQPDGGKFFYPGGRVEGCYFEFGKLHTMESLYVVEGYSTGFSISSAIGAPTVVCFSANNLIKVAQAFKAKHKDIQIIVAGDDDQWTQKPNGDAWNPGREKANEAAKKVFGKAVFPKFASLDGSPTDWNDLHQREGIEAVKKQISEVKVEKAFIVPLGFRGKEYFFTSSSNKQISPIIGFSETDLYSLMPKEYWEAAYPGRNGVDWPQAKSELMLACRKKGIFEPRNVRGSGVWYDQSRVVVNLGDCLVVDDQTIPLDQFPSRYFYTLGRRLPAINTSPLTLSECELLREVCTSFKWVNDEHGILLAGALITSKICGSLPIRPHIWITGGAYTGKSTLLERLVYPVLEDRCLFLQGGTTEPGLRQAIGADAVPVIFDEFETTDKKSSSTVQSIIELMRSTWSEGHGNIAKGGTGGVATFYHPRFSGIVSSIRTNLTNDADKSRFAILELAPHGSDQTHWAALDSKLRQIDSDYIDRLFARSIYLLPVLLENFKNIKKAFAQKVTARFGDHYGMLLAGVSILVSDSALTPQDVEALIGEMGMHAETEQAKETDHEDCLHQLVSKKIRFDISGVTNSATELTIGEAITKASKTPKDEIAKSVQRIGIKVEGESVFVASQHPELKQVVFRGTRWEHCWGQTLGRLAGAKKSQQTRFLGKQIRAVEIPMSQFPSEPDAPTEEQKRDSVTAASRHL